MLLGLFLGVLVVGALRDMRAVVTELRQPVIKDFWGGFFLALKLDLLAFNPAVNGVESPRRGE
jgi:hypothetical protein